MKTPVAKGFSALALLLSVVALAQEAATGDPRLADPTALASAATPTSEIVSFLNGTLTLKGVLFKPEGVGPFPAVLYNHGSAAGMVSQEAFDALGPVFVRHRWVFFGPYRRGQGLSAQAGPYIGTEIEKAKKQAGLAAGAATMIRL